MSQYDWHGIETEPCLLQGDQGAIELHAVSILAGEKGLNDPAAIGIRAKIRVHNVHGPTPLEISWHHTFYGSLDQVICEFGNLRSGTATTASFEMTGLTIRAFEHTSGPRSGLCVTADVSNVLPTTNSPWPDDIGDWLLLKEEASFHLRFAFVSHLVDPPFIDRFIAGLRELRKHLAQL